MCAAGRAFRTSVRVSRFSTRSLRTTGMDCHVASTCKGICSRNIVNRASVPVNGLGRVKRISFPLGSVPSTVGLGVRMQIRKASTIGS